MDKKIEKKPLLKRKKFWFTVAAGALFLVLIIAILADTGSKLNVETDKITISTVSEGDFQEFIPITGNVLPRTTFYLDVVLGGSVEQKYIEEGSMVRRGDKIIKC